MSKKSLGVVGLSLAGLLALSAGVHAAPSYTLQDLGSGFTPRAINQAGDITGYLTGLGPVLRQNGVTTGLGSSYGSGWAINDAGTVAGGTVFGTGLSDPFQAFTYQNGVRANLGPAVNGLNPGESTAYGINNAGQVVGSVGDVSSWEDTRRGFLYSNGTATDVGSFGGATVATDINNHGQIAGYSAYQPSYGSSPHAFVSNQGVLTDLGTLVGGSFSYAMAINDSGRVLGISSYGDPSSPFPPPYPSAPMHAFLSSASGLVDLGTLGGADSFGYALNIAGQAVGTSSTASGEFHAFVYSDGALIDLNSALSHSGTGWVLDYAFGINDKGIIVGAGHLDNGDVRGFMLTPVPEPENVALVLAGLMVVGTCLRGKRSKG